MRAGEERKGRAAPQLQRHGDGEVVQEHRVDDADVEHARELAHGGVEVHGAQRELGEPGVGHVEFQLRVANARTGRGVRGRARLVCGAGEAELVLRGDAPEAGEAARGRRAPAEGEGRAPGARRLSAPTTTAKLPCAVCETVKRKAAAPPTATRRTCVTLSEWFQKLDALGCRGGSTQSSPART